MKIVIDYEKEKNNCCYYNNVMAAIETANEKFFIDNVVFVNFPFKEIIPILSLIKRTTKTGIIKFIEDTIVYEKDENQLNVLIPESL